jgi:type II secretory pathway component GspD/PulD (secretin)
MKWLVSLAPASVLAILLVAGSAAQEPENAPEFQDAPVTEVLAWAHRTLGVGFVYDGAVLRGPGGEGPRRVSANHSRPENRAESTLMLFELLRRCGLVAFEVEGMPGPTYQLYAADGAARAAPLLSHLDDLGGLLFAALAIRLERATAEALAPRIRTVMTPGVGSVQILETTQTLIVTDYADRLRAAWALALAADAPHERDDDRAVHDHAARSAPADKLAAALERIREPGETFRVAVNASANVVLISGTRAEVRRAGEALERLDAHPENPAFREETHTIKLIHLEPGAAARTLREMFQPQVAAGSVQIGVFERDRRVVFRGTGWDYERAAATLRRLDMPAGE